MKINKIEIKPRSRINAEIDIPGSKSITNRALIIAAMSDGECVLRNALFSDDTKYMQLALKELCIEVKSNESTNEIIVVGKKGIICKPQNDLYLGNAGTAIRFLTSLTAIGEGEFILTGDERMQERPIGDLVDGLKSLGARISYLKNEGYPPIKVISSRLNGGKTKMKGNISSQFFSSILISGAYAKNDVEVEVVGEMVSKPYIDITIKVMQDFGVQSINEGYKYFKIPSEQVYKHQDYTIEGDASNASYFFAAAAITGGRVRVNNIDFSTKQGDIEFVKILEKMGCSINDGKNFIEVKGGPLKGIDIDMHNISDVVQTLAVVALFAKGRTVIRNVANMRVKETDRLRALYNELSKLGAKIIEMEDGLVINPIDNYNPSAIDTYNDHRMAMSFSLAGLKINGIIINDPGCVSKTFPNYFTLFNSLK